MSLDINSISKLKPMSSVSIDFLYDIKQLHKTKDFEQLEVELTSKVIELKKQLIAKPHLKKVRNQLKQCYEFLVETSYQNPTKFLPEIKKFKYKVKPLRIVKALFMDNLIENEWKKQCNGKYGGEKYF